MADLTVAEASRRGMRFSRRIAVKAGTPVLTHMDGSIALGRIGSLVEQIAALRREGRDVLLITGMPLAGDTPWRCP